MIRIGDTAVLYTPAGVQTADVSTAPPSGAVTPVLEVSYAIGATRYRTSVIDNVTTISATAPFSVTFDAYGSVSTGSDCDTALKGFVNLRFSYNFGEARGTTWGTTGLSTDTERGGAVAGYTFETPGTHQAVLTVEDSAGNSQPIRVNFVISSPGSGVAMTSGVIPTFADNTVYDAPAGGTWGDITSQLRGKVNVIIRKSGSGADPVFGTVTLDDRNEPTGSVTRTIGVRFLNCDVGKVTCGNLGFDYCSFVNGRVRSVEVPTWYSAADQAVVNKATRTVEQGYNVRTPRGLFLQNTGDLGEPGGSDYVLFVDGLQELHLRGVTLTKDTVGQHNLRGVLRKSSIRNCIHRNIVAGTTSFNKLQGWDCTVGVSLPSQHGTPDAWPEDDTVVAFATGGDNKPNRILGLPSSRVCWSDTIMGPSGSNQPTTNFGIGPENNNVEPAQGCELITVDYCYSDISTQWFQPSATGRFIRFDYRYGGASGTQFTVSEGTDQPNRVPDGWNGPYSSGRRPVPSP